MTVTDIDTGATTSDQTPNESPTPTHGELLDRLRTELCDVNPDIAADLPADRHLIDELGVDSLDLIEFVARIEYDYGVLVPDEDIDRLTSLDAIADYMIEAIDAG